MADAQKRPEFLVTERHGGASIEIGAAVGAGLIVSHCNHDALAIWSGYENYTGEA